MISAPARRLSPYIGQTLPKGSISAIERGLERDRRRTFDAQELAAFAAGFDLPMWWFFMPVRGTERMRLDRIGDRATELLVLFLGRQDQLEMLKSEVASFRSGADRTAIEEVLERSSPRPAGGTSRRVGCSRSRSLRTGRRASSSSSSACCVTSLGSSTACSSASFLGTSSRRPSWSGYRARSTGGLRKCCWASRSGTGSTGSTSPRDPPLRLLLDRLDLPLEDWIDTDDPELRKRVEAVFARIEEQLADKEIPPPPEARFDD